MDIGKVTSLPSGNERGGDVETLLPVLDALPQAVLLHDAGGQLLFANSSAISLLEFNTETLADDSQMSEKWAALNEDGSRAQWKDFPAFEAIHTGKQIEQTIQVIRKSNRSYWVKIQSTPIIDQSTQQLIKIVTSFCVVLDRKTANEQLEHSEKRWRSLLNSSRSGLFLIDRNYNFIIANQMGKKLFDLEQEPFDRTKPLNFLEVIPEERRQAVRKVLENTLKGLPTEYEVFYTKNDGGPLWLLANYSPVKEEDGQISAVCLSITDITDQKTKEAELQKSESRWKFALDGAGDGVWEYNFSTNESYYSPLYKSMLGFSEHEFKNEFFEWKTRVHEEDLKRINEIDRQYLENQRQNHSVEYRIRNKAGEYIWVLDRGMVMEHTADGKPLKIVGTHKNITERKLYETTLQITEQRFSSFMANTPTMNWIIDEHDVFRYLNQQYLVGFQLSESDIGRSIHEIFPESVCKEFIENNWKVWNDGRALETIEEGVGPDGEQQFYQIFKFPLESENGVRMLGGVALDITKKMQIEQQLAADEEKKKREIIQAIIDAQEKERKELAYELHDNVNQILTSSKLMLEVAAEKPALCADFVGRSLNYLNEAIVEIRKISHSLTPGTLRDISLEAAVDELVQTINSTGKIKISYLKSIAITEKEVPAAVQLAALRIAQEQLNNILKHSNASEAVVSLSVTAEKVGMNFTDNGRGFNMETTRRGLGLNNIITRVEYYHGTVELQTSPGNGCSLMINIPL